MTNWWEKLNEIYIPSPETCIKYLNRQNLFTLKKKKRKHDTRIFKAIKVIEIIFEKLSQIS